jgi:hypothetical protein
LGRGNDVLNKPATFYFKNENEADDYDNYDDNYIKIEETTNLTNANHFKKLYNDIPNITASGKRRSVQLATDIRNAWISG